MSAGEAPGTAQLLKSAVEGQRLRGAASALHDVGPPLAAAIRRALPFLARRGTTVLPIATATVALDEAMADLPSPRYRMSLVTAPDAGSGAVVLDAAAISLLLDGVLGGDGKHPAPLDPSGLSTPQIALLQRTLAGVVDTLAATLKLRLGLAIAPAPSAVGRSAPSDEGTPATLTFQLGENPEDGKLVLALPSDALLQHADRKGAPPGEDPRVARTLQEVDLELVAELGRLKVSLQRLASLRVGDVLRLDVAVDSAVSVRADGRPILAGRPTSSSGRIAVKITGHGR